jgi:hypothetical protein
VQIRLDESGPAPEPAAKPDRERAVEPDPTVSPRLTAAGKHQDQVIASLEQMLAQLSRWDNYRRFHREIGQLLREQEELSRRGTELGRRTLTKDVKNLPPQEMADLKIAAQQQLEMARRLDHIQQDMDETASQLRESDPMAAETLSDALHRARQLTITGQMRSAADALESNRMGQAMDRQKQVVQNLQEILDILANRREPELTRLVKKLREAEADLAQMARQEEGLRKRMEEAQATSDPQQQRRQLEQLSRQQEKLQEEAQRMARRLERLSAHAAAKSTGRAADKMNQASQAAGQGRAGGAAAKASEAQKSLQNAARQLAQQRREAQVQLAMEQMARLQDVLRQARERQEKLIAETRRIDQLQQNQGRLTRDQAATVRDLAREQGSLQSETAELAQKLVGAEVFHLALSAAADEMGKAAGLLGQRQTGAGTQQAEQNALSRLDQLLKALEPEKPNKPAEKTGGGGQGGQGGQPPGGVHALAELKLVKLMQEELNRRTRELEKAFGRAGAMSEEARRQYIRLGEEQGQLASLLLQLIKPAENPEDNPDDLPELKEDTDGPGDSPLPKPRKGTP